MLKLKSEVQRESTATMVTGSHIWNANLPGTAEQSIGLQPRWLDNTTQLTYVTDPDYADVDGPLHAASSGPAQVCAPRNALPETMLHSSSILVLEKPGLALPLIALQYHEVKINLDLRPIGECLWAVSDLVNGSSVQTAYQQGLWYFSLRRLCLP